MSSTKVEVVFEGAAVEAGAIDARLLAESLIGYSEVFTRTNSLVNGNASEAAVLVQSEFKHGSFIADLQFIQNIAEQATRLITSHVFHDAAGLAGIIGFVWKNREIVRDSLIDLYKWLKGGKPDKAVQVGNNFELTIGQSKKTVSSVVFNLDGDSAIRVGLERLTSPLRQAAIDRIAVRQDGREQTSIEKQESTYFEAEPLRLDSSEAAMEGNRDTVLIVSKLSFVEGSTWTFIEKGATLVAKVEDDEFWAKIHQHQLTFGEGDRLRVSLNWKVVATKTKKLVPKNTIIRVYEVVGNPIQLHLGSAEG